MAYKVITPATAPITLEELRAQLRLDTISGVNAEDSLIQDKLMGALELAELYSNRSIGVQTLEMALDEFPGACAGVDPFDLPNGALSLLGGNQSGAIELERGPVTSITQVTYVDTSGTVQTMDTTAYTLDDYSLKPWLVPAAGTSWPTTYAAINAVKIRYVTGYATLPYAVKAALLLIVGHLHKNRLNASSMPVTEIPMGACSLLDTIKIWSC